MEQTLDYSIPGSSKGSIQINSNNNSFKSGSGPWGFTSVHDAFRGSSDVTLFSSSLPVLPHEKLNFREPRISPADDDNTFNSRELDQAMEDKDPLADFKTSHAIGSLLPDDVDELLSGIMDDFDFSGLPNQMEELEEYDLFGSGGGMELDYDHESLTMSMARANLIDSYAGNGTGQYGLSNSVGTIAGEHPYGEHPSRTLFVRNINSNVEDSELRSLFEQFGDIRTLYTACKHRGFVMISYYDIRAARTAMRALQNKPLRRRKLDIHFSIPKDNPSEKDINQGTLVAFNLDPSVSNDDLRQIFGVYGEVKEIRETPHKRHHKFIEFYDVRAAEAALRSLNRSDIAGKRIKLEPSRPGGARRNLLQQLSQDLEQDDARSYRHPVDSPLTNSPPGAWAQLGSPNENGSLQNLSRSPTLGSISPVTTNHLPGLASILPPIVSGKAKIAPIGKDQRHGSHVDTLAHGSALQHPHSFTEGLMQSMGPNHGTVSPFGLSNLNSSELGTLTGPQFLWGSPTYSEPLRSSAWSTSSVGHPFTSNGQGGGFPYSSRPGSFIGSSHNHHHVGSAPSGAPFVRHYGFFPQSPETSFTNPVPNAYGGIGFNRSDGNFMVNMGARAATNPAVAFSGTLSENGSPGYRMLSSQRLSPMILGSGGMYPGSSLNSLEGFNERGRRRSEATGNHTDSKKQYQLDLDKIIGGEDTRTTLMIKNIPNKYTSKMLLGAIDENHKGTYDFLYLPIDFKNKCNVGYAFINMISPSHIISFYQAFNGKKWEKFNSEKVASLAYARIQGRTALVTHFQNSSLMNEDKRCRPILFHPEGSDSFDQESFLSSNLNIRVLKQEGIINSQDLSEIAKKEASSSSGEKGSGNDVVEC